MHLNLAYLASLVAVADSRSLSEAARRLRRPQSTISTHVSRLEDLLGRPLIRRQGRGVVLTQDAEALVSIGRRMMELNIEALARFGVGESASVIRFGMPETFMSDRILDVLHRLSERHVGTEIEIAIVPSADLKKMLAVGELDVICAMRAHPREGDLLWSERLVWVGRHALIEDASRPLPLINYPANCPYREIIENALAGGMVRFRNSQVGGTLSSVARSVQLGLGITAMDETFARDRKLPMIDDRKLPLLPVVEFYVQSQVYMTELRKTKARAELVSLLKQECTGGRTLLLDQYCVPPGKAPTHRSDRRAKAARPINRFEN